MRVPAVANRWLGLVEESFRREVGPQAVLPGPDTDLLETGILDSIGWVSFLRALESAGLRSDLGSLLTDQPATFASILRALESGATARLAIEVDSPNHEPARFGSPSFVAASHAVVGSRTIPSEEIDKAFGMPPGKLRRRAGIESLAYAAAGENELTLAAKAVEQALSTGDCGAQEVDWIIATSETQRGFPSLAPQLHSHLLAREACGALDVGGACLGLLNGLAVAQGLIASGRARNIVVVTADVHSPVFTPGRVPGEFGGLFGDGASAFLLRDSTDASASRYRLGEFFFGCAGQYAGAIRITESLSGVLDLHFDGEALSRAAITRLEKVLASIELRSGIPRSSVDGFATHQPNPRLLAVLARQYGIPEEKFPPIAKSSGNLGSSTCGAALHAILRSAEANQTGQPIFLASLGPGLLFGGGWLIPEENE